MAKANEPDAGLVESDEDSEVYFLKPVNEYNIVDKIKEANKELFSTNSGDANNDPESDTNGNVNSNGAVELNSRKVTFAANLEHYEPAGSEALGSGNNNESDDECEPIGQGVAKKERGKFEAIAEEDAEIRANEDEIAVLVAEDKQLMTQLEGQLDQRAPEAAADDEVDEICEEIVGMDMDSEVVVAEATQRRVVKQDTFDCDTKRLSSDDEAGAEDDERAEKSSDDEERESASNEEEVEEEEEEDDTDNLSIIVSAYVPDDFGRVRSPSAERKSQENCKASKLSLTKRFSFRRKSKGGTPHGAGPAHPPPSNCCMQPSMTSASSRGHQHVPLLPADTEVTALKLHYKTCCEYRNSTLDRLPRYTGYLSEYGLSREQLLEREQRLQKKHRFVLQQTLKTTEQEMRKMQDNERAFTTWLKNKMRYPINRTRNMFDARRKSKVSAPPPPPMPPATVPPPFRRHCIAASGGESPATGCSSLMSPFMSEFAMFKHASN